LRGDGSPGGGSTVAGQPRPHVQHGPVSVPDGGGHLLACVVGGVGGKLTLDRHVNVRCRHRCCSAHSTLLAADAGTTPGDRAGSKVPERTRIRGLAAGRASPLVRAGTSCPVACGPAGGRCPPAIPRRWEGTVRATTVSQVMTS